jgi:hypothetical protein
MIPIVMNAFPTILAAATALPKPTTKPSDSLSAALDWFLSYPSEWPGLQQLLNSCESMSQGTSTILIIAGLGFLAYGHSAHRLCMSLNCTIIGAWVGGMLGKQGNAVVPGMLIGGFLGGLCAWPMLTFSIQLIAAAIGFAAGSCVWKTFPNLEAHYAWAGGCMGMIFLYMLSHITLRWTVILATGVQGAAMLIMGILGWLYQIASIRGSIDNALMNNHYALPLAIAIPAIFGLIYQHHSAAPTPAPAKK